MQTREGGLGVILLNFGNEDFEVQKGNKIV